MLFIWCLLGGLIILFSPVSLTNKLQLAYTSVFRWPLAAGQRASLATRAIPSLGVVNDAPTDETTKEHLLLRNTIDDLKSQLAQARQDIERLSHIRHVMPRWEGMSLLPADVTVTGRTQSVLYINRGQQNGVAVGQYVVGDMSIIGIISAVSARTARVRLITDPTSKIPVTLGESDLAWVMEGRPGNVAKVPRVPAGHPVSEGMQVYARKMPGVLDVPIIVARVKTSRIDPENPLLLDITVQPACDLSALTGVMVIVSPPQK